VFLYCSDVLLLFYNWKLWEQTLRLWHYSVAPCCTVYSTLCSTSRRPCATSANIHMPSSLYNKPVNMFRPNWPSSGVQDIGMKEPAALLLCSSDFIFVVPRNILLIRVIMPLLCNCLVIFLLVCWFILCSVCGCSQCHEWKLGCWKRAFKATRDSHKGMWHERSNPELWSEKKRPFLGYATVNTRGIC
jgi:hypothetical protein